MFWEMYQPSQQDSYAAHAAERAGREAKRTADRTSRAQDELEERVESLALTCQALFEILAERTGVTQDQLAAKIEEIDLRDGVKDGKFRPQPLVCSDCGRRTARKRDRCMYCGGECK